MISISADNEWPTRCLRCFPFFSLSLFLFAIFRSFDSLLSSFSVNLGQFRIPISFLSFFRRSIFESFWKKVVRISKIVEIFFPLVIRRRRSARCKEINAGSGRNSEGKGGGKKEKEENIKAREWRGRTRKDLQLTSPLFLPPFGRGFVGPEGPLVRTFAKLSTDFSPRYPFFSALSRATPPPPPPSPVARVFKGRTKATGNCSRLFRHYGRSTPVFLSSFSFSSSCSFSLSLRVSLPSLFFPRHRRFSRGGNRFPIIADLDSEIISLPLTNKSLLR